MTARIFSALVPGTLVLQRRRDARGFEPGDAVRIEHAGGLPRQSEGTVREVDKGEGIVWLSEAVMAQAGDWLVVKGEGP